MDNHTLIAVDVAKSVFEIVVSHEPGKVHERARVPRNKFLAFFRPAPSRDRRHVPRAWGLIEDADSGLPDALREPFAEVCRELRTLEERVKGIDHQLAALAEQLPVVERLRSIPGVGLLTATAVVAQTR